MNEKIHEPLCMHTPKRTPLKALTQITRFTACPLLLSACQGSALSHIGLPCGATTAPYISTPFYSHALVQWVVDHLFTKKFWISYTRRMHVDIRRRALAKAERAKRSE